MSADKSVVQMNIREKPKNKNADDELWKKIYRENEKKFKNSIKDSEFKIIIFDENGNIIPFDPNKFLDEDFVPQALKSFINDVYDRNIISYLNYTYKHKGTMLMFVNRSTDRLNIRYESEL